MPKLMLRHLFLYEEYCSDSTEPISSVTPGVLPCHPERGQAEGFIKTVSHPISHHSITHPGWWLEVYRTITETLQDVAWMLLVFFVFTLIAFMLLSGYSK